ncbi:hypothetical protein PR048_005185 [Dryococelus australis]|uniref:Uncharacterized protein n=1 Tax=Dryococelus australis TaxID=614101 RepID=A0ABQ9I7H9_9NEOP|nr:hypothetical protein PR048_005185 [Dryococelus australis]
MDPLSGLHVPLTLRPRTFFWGGGGYVKDRVYATAMPDFQNPVLGLWTPLLPSFRTCSRGPGRNLNTGFIYFVSSQELTFDETTHLAVVNSACKRKSGKSTFSKKDRAVSGTLLLLCPGGTLRVWREPHPDHVLNADYERLSVTHPSKHGKIRTGIGSVKASRQTPASRYWPYASLMPEAARWKYELAADCWPTVSGLRPLDVIMMSGLRLLDVATMPGLQRDDASHQLCDKRREDIPCKISARICLTPNARKRLRRAGNSFNTCALWRPIADNTGAETDSEADRILFLKVTSLTSDKPMYNFERNDDYNHETFLPEEDDDLGGLVHIPREAATGEIMKHSQVLLTRLPLRRTVVDSRQGRSGIFTCGNRARRCRWSLGFLGDIPFPRPFIMALLNTSLYPHRLSRPRCLEPPESLHFTPQKTVHNKASTLEINLRKGPPNSPTPISSNFPTHWNDRCILRAVLLAPLGASHSCLRLKYFVCPRHCRRGPNLGPRSKPREAAYSSDEHAQAGMYDGLPEENASLFGDALDYVQFQIPVHTLLYLMGQHIILIVALQFRRTKSRRCGDLPDSSKEHKFGRRLCIVFNDIQDGKEEIRNDEKSHHIEEVRSQFQSQLASCCTIRIILRQINNETRCPHTREQRRLTSRGSIKSSLFVTENSIKTTFLRRRYFCSRKDVTCLGCLARLKWLGQENCVFPPAEVGFKGKEGGEAGGM